MGLEELKEHYKEMDSDEFKKNLNIDLALMKITGQLDLKYAIMLNVAQEKGMLDKTEIEHYKKEGFNALSDYLLKDLEK